MAKRYHIVVKTTQERLELVGPLIAGWWSRPDDELGRRMPGEFLLDTGAHGAMIDSEAAEALQLVARGTREIHGIHGYGSLLQYSARMTLQAQDVDGSHCLFEQEIECVAVPGLAGRSRENAAQVIGILGRIFLRRAHLEIDGTCGAIRLIVQS